MAVAREIVSVKHGSPVSYPGGRSYQFEWAAGDEFTVQVRGADGEVRSGTLSRKSDPFRTEHVDGEVIVTSLGHSRGMVRIAYDPSELEANERRVAREGPVGIVQNISDNKVEVESRAVEYEAEGEDRMEVVPAKVRGAATVHSAGTPLPEDKADAKLEAEIRGASKVSKAPARKRTTKSKTATKAPAKRTTRKAAARKAPAKRARTAKKRG